MSDTLAIWIGATILVGFAGWLVYFYWFTPEQRRMRREYNAGRPVEKRGGYQPVASGLPPTEPPPKRSDARQSAVAPWPHQPDVPWTSEELQHGRIVRSADGLPAKMGWDAFDLALGVLREIAQDDPRKHDANVLRPGWDSYHRLRELARAFVREYDRNRKPA